MQRKEGRRLGWRFLFCTLAAFAAEGFGQTVFDPAQDFSATLNPNGAWSYGYAASPGQFTAYTLTGTFGTGVNSWSRSSVYPDNYPLIFHNPSASPVVYDATLTIPAGQFGFHPGYDGSGAVFSVARLTLPNAGAFRLDAVFSGLESFSGGTTTDVHIRIAGTNAFDGSIGGFGQTATVSNYIFSANAGTVIDFLVGNGGNNFNSDTTGLSASIMSVPEPGTTSLLCVGAVIVLLMRRRFGSG
jgi:hypothetical protein